MTFLNPAIEITIERGLEIMNGDEYLEVTPKSARIRKKLLHAGNRTKLVLGTNCFEDIFMFRKPLIKIACPACRVREEHFQRGADHCR